MMGAEEVGGRDEREGAQAALALLDAAVAREDAPDRLIWADPRRAIAVFGQDMRGRPLHTLFSADVLAARTRLRAAARAARGPYRVLLPLAHAPERMVEERGDFSDEASAPLCVFRPTGRRAPVAHAEQNAEGVADALAQGRVALMFQPVVLAGSRRIVRHEALLRFREADGRLSAPGARIEAAERAGLVGALDLVALDLGLSALDAREDVELSVNVSAGTIADASAAEAYARRVVHSGMTARRLTVEITETFALEDIERCAAFATKLRAAGARLALDDFGAGYTSFRTLKALPLDEVKIDGAYARDVAENPANAAFVRALNELAVALGLETVAEQVETPEAADALKAIGVDMLQGYLFGAPSTGMRIAA